MNALWNSFVRDEQGQGPGRVHTTFVVRVPGDRGVICQLRRQYVWYLGQRQQQARRRQHFG